MDKETMTKEEIALELAITVYNKSVPVNQDPSPEGEGKAMAALYNSILENLNL